MDGQTPNITAHFHTRNGLTFTAHPKAYNSHRSLNDPAASASLTFRGLRWQGTSNAKLDGQEIDSTLSLHDLCEIKITDRAGRVWTDVLGLINSIRVIRDNDSSSPSNGVVLQVMGLGDALQRYFLLWHPHIAGKANLGNLDMLRRLGGQIPKGRPDEVLSAFYGAFVNGDYIFALADGHKLNEVLQPRFQVMKDGYAQIALSSLGGRESLWALLKKYSNPPWGELFVDLQREQLNPARYNGLGPTTDLKRGVVGVYFRPTPFEIEVWDRLKMEDGWGYEYEESERMHLEAFARDADDVYNFFWAPAKSVHSAFRQQAILYGQSNGKLPIYDDDSIRRFGLKKYEEKSEYIQFFKGTDEKHTQLTLAQRRLFGTTENSAMALIKKRTEQLALWFGYENFYRGSLVLRGRIGAHRQFGGRIGSILRRKRDGHEGYITAISQDWEFPGPHQTTFEVIRMHDPKQYRAWVARRKLALERQGTLALGPSIAFS